MMIINAKSIGSMRQISADFTRPVVHAVQRLGHRAPIGGAVKRAHRVFADLAAALGVGDASTRDNRPALEAKLVEARLVAAQWQSRAEACEAQVAILEARLAASEVTTLDLRSRLVCLHGKLATTTATARYQTLAHALDAQASTAAIAAGMRGEPSEG